MGIDIMLKSLFFCRYLIKIFGLGVQGIGIPIWRGGEKVKNNLMFLEHSISLNFNKYANKHKQQYCFSRRKKIE